MPPSWDPPTKKKPLVANHKTDTQGCADHGGRMSDERDELRAALKPFAQLPLWKDTYPDARVDLIIGVGERGMPITPDDVRRARAALERDGE